MSYGIKYTDEMRQFILENYDGTPTRELADRFNSKFGTNVKPVAIGSYKKRYGLKSGLSGNFSKGHIPHNKGKKMPPEVYEKVKATMFKKGQMPTKHRPVGSERVNVDGYVEVKVAEPGKWRLKHRVVWEEANGPIPPGYNIQFRNKNRQDLRLENLYLISRAEQMGTENSIHARYPEELKKVIRLKGAIKRQITEHYKRNNRNGK